MLPVGVAAAPQADALAWLPVVGAVTGLLAGTAGWLVSLVAPHPLAAAAAFGAALVLTGAIHLDGFLDCCDALFAPVPVARRLEILKDPQHGTFALAGFGIVAAGWLGALVSLPPVAYPWALAFAGAAARFGAVFNAYVFPYGRAGASVRAFEQRPNVGILAFALLVTVSCAWYRPALAIAVPFAVAGALLLGRAAAGRLGGALVGDVYGAIVTLVEVVLLGIVAALR